MKNIDLLSDCLAGETLPQALVFVCTKGNEQVNSVIKSLLCLHMQNGKSCGKCNSCTTFDAESNPDLFILGEESSIKVDDIRKLKADGYIRPVLSDRKVFFLQNAETMTREAQNALLKIFEEPPKYLTIVLQTAQKSSLLETILSRATCFYFEEGPAARDEAITESCVQLMNYIENGDFYGLLTFAPKLSKNKEQFENMLRHLLFLCRDILAQKAGVGTVGNKISSKTAYTIYEKTIKYSKALDTNAGLPLLATAFLVEITE